MPTLSASRQRSDRLPPPGRLERPPWARVRKVQLIRREIREYLPKGSLDVLFSSAEHVVEGSPEIGDDGPGRVYATLMVTIDLRRSAEYFREPPDDASAARVAELMEDNDDVYDKVVELARPKLAELAARGGTPNPDLDVALEVSVRAEGTKVLIDADAMGSPHRRQRR